jgi:hypothetical protein
MSDRFTRDERGPTERNADARLARRAREEMRAAVTNLRAGFGADLPASPDVESEVARDNAEPRFTRPGGDD